MYQPSMPYREYKARHIATGTPDANHALIERACQLARDIPDPPIDRINLSDNEVRKVNWIYWRAGDAQWSFAIANSPEEVVAAYAVGFLPFEKDSDRSVMVLRPGHLGEPRVKRFFREATAQGWPLILDCREEGYPFEEDSSTAWGIRYRGDIPGNVLASYARTACQYSIGHLWQSSLFIDANGKPHTRALGIKKIATFTRALSLGRYGLSREVMNGLLMGMWQSRALRAIGAVSSDRGLTDALGEIGHVLDIYDLWRMYMEEHRISLRISREDLEDEDQALGIFRNIAEAMGLDKTIEAYSSGLAIEDILDGIRPGNASRQWISTRWDSDSKC